MLTKSYTCLICGEIIKVDCDDEKHLNSKLTKNVNNHIKNIHNITIEEYSIKYYHNNIRPKCECGCGQEIKFKPKNYLFSDRHGFQRYFSSSHVHTMDNKTRNKLKLTFQKKRTNIEYLTQYYEESYGLNNIKEALNDFLNNDYPIGKISEKYHIDKRTIKKIWLSLNLITEEKYKEQIKYYQFKYSAKCRKKYFQNDIEICDELYKICQAFPSKYNIRSLIREYNENHLNQIDVDPKIVYNRLYELYGNIIYQLLADGIHSKEEYDFYKIIKFYLPHAKIKLGYKIKYGKNNLESYIYDICIDNKLIIEYDGDGYYHQGEKSFKRDKNKEILAINNNFIFLRISLNEALNPNTIIKIKKLLYEN